MNETRIPYNTGPPERRPATEKSVNALLAAFAVEHCEAFERYCADNGEDANSLLQWRIMDWADAYRSGCSDLWEQPAEATPLFRAQSDGRPKPDPRWAGAVTGFCGGVRAAVGQHPNARWWPYRSGNAACLAFDASGDRGDVSLTILEGDCVNIPLEGGQPGNADPQVVDLVDAFYLVALLLESLGLASWEGFWGPRMIDK